MGSRSTSCRRLSTGNATICFICRSTRWPVSSVVISAATSSFGTTTMRMSTRHMSIDAHGNPDGAGGYAHKTYVESFAEIGRAHELTRCGGWLLERAIPGCDLRDGMGCYPMFACLNWEGLGGDLDALGTRLVSVS